MGPVRRRQVAHGLEMARRVGPDGRKFPNPGRKVSAAPAAAQIVISSQFLEKDCDLTEKNLDTETCLGIAERPPFQKIPGHRLQVVEESHEPGQYHDSPRCNRQVRKIYKVRKLRRRFFPSEVRMDSGWNCTPYTGSSLWARPMISPSSVHAVMRRHSGRVSRLTSSE